MSLSLGEKLYHPIESIWHQFLQTHHLKMQISPLSLHTWIVKDIYYRQKPLAREVKITLNLSSLLHAKLTIDNIVIKQLDLNTLQSMQESSGSSQGVVLPLFIKRAHINAVYRYKEPFFIDARIQEATLHQAKVTDLTVRSKKLTLHSYGMYKNGKLELKGTSKIASFIKELKIEKPILFTASIDSKKILFELTENEARFKQLRTKNLKVLGIYDYRSLKARFKAKITYPHGEAYAQGKISYINDLRLTLHAKAKNEPFLPSIRYDAYKTFNIEANASIQKISIQLTNPKWNAFATIEDLKRFQLSTSTIDLDKIMQKYPKNLPKVTAALRANGTVRSGIFELNSNFASIKGTWHNRIYNASTVFLKDFGSLHLTKLSPTDIWIDLRQKRAKVSNKFFTARINNGNKVDITMPKTVLTIRKNGNFIEGDFKTESTKLLVKHLSQIYPYAISLDTKAKAHFVYNLKNRKYRVTLTIPKQKGQGWKNVIDYFTLALHGQDSNITVDYYALVVRSHGFYATKPSYIQWKKNRIIVKRIWIDDAISVVGDYNLDRQKGTFHISSNLYHYASIEGDLKLALALQGRIDHDNIDIEGKITPLGGVITYEPKKHRTIEDKDIIVIDETSSSRSRLYENLQVAIQIESQKPLLYKIPNLWVLFKPSLMLYKEPQKQMQLLGYIKLLKGIFTNNDTRFEILPSQLDFYGPLTDPLLELSLKTKKAGYLIFLSVSGDAESPILHFDSEPPLSPNDILSILAFGNKADSLISAATGSSKFTAMLSNLFLKDLIGKLGLKLDKISLITTGEKIGFEIGKKISNKITIIYKNDVISTLIIQYLINNSLESDIVVGPQRSGFHIYYRKVK